MSPWHVEKKSGSRPYKIVRSDTGKVVGSSVSKSKAQSSVNHRYAGTKMERGLPQHKEKY